MKTLLITTSDKIKNHVNEEYDDYYEGVDIPQSTDLPAIANTIRNIIRKIVLDAQQEGLQDYNYVNIFIDATPFYGVILVSLEDNMKKEEKIFLNLPEEYNRENIKRESLISESELEKEKE